MAYRDYKRLLQADSDVVALKALRSKSAALILCFLQEAFKTTDYSPTIAHEKLVNGLADFLEVEGVGREENLDELFLTSEEKAAKYLKDWVRDGYLSLFTDESGQDSYSLTPGIENGLDWVASLMQKRSFVGTESRFLDIFHKLRELVQNTSEDWEAKIEELENQKSAIDAKIRAIQLTKKVDVFEDYQIKDRFLQINAVARSLLRDFREVEGNFQEITRDIYKKQTSENHNKGNLLGFSLDALDELRATDQGRSFQAFYQHLSDPYQKKELDDLIRRVFALLEDKNIENEDPFLRRIKFYLHSEGEKVNDSFYQLVKKLEKIISEKNIRDRRKSLQLINDIKRLALEWAENPPGNEVFLEIEDRADFISTDFFASLKEKESRINARALNTAAEEDFELVVNQNVVDKSVLVANVQHLLKSNTQATLRQVVEEFPLKHGLSELMAYGSIAAASASHIVNDTRRETFQLSKRRKVEFPEIIFCRKS